MGPGATPTVPSAKAKATAKRNQKDTSSGRTGSSSTQAIVEAAKQRAKTTKEWKSVQTSLSNAKKVGDQLLNETAPACMGGEADSDKRLDLLRQRMILLNASMNVNTEQSQVNKANMELYDLCLLDPYLKDLQQTLLSSRDAAQTIGSITRVRDTLLDIQGSTEKVRELMEIQKVSMQLLKKIAQCVVTEAESWKTGYQALKKAKEIEEQAKEKAELQEKKAEEKKQKRIDAAQQREAEKEAKKAEDAAKAAQEQEEGGGGDGDEGDGETRKSRRRTLGKEELDESDPSVLRELRTSVPQTKMVEELNEFISEIVYRPEHPCVVRLKKGSFGKVLNVPLSKLMVLANIWMVTESVVHDNVPGCCVNYRLCVAFPFPDLA